MILERSSGILLHPTSLPGKYGCGDIGPQAHQFLEELVESKQHIWQVLPLGPTGYGDSPYQLFSAFAGNPLLISLDNLLEQGLLAAEDLANPPSFPVDKVDFGAVIQYRTDRLTRSFERFKTGCKPILVDEFDVFCREQWRWLDDFALFMALKEVHGGTSWTDWQADIAAREPIALERWKQDLSDPIHRHKYIQYQFFKQWAELKQAAELAEIQIIGDIPIFVAHDSADVWAHPEFFHLDKNGHPTVVAGVPPDYFSRTGQLWGNPLYRWDLLKDRGYEWWIDRVRSTLATVDIVRLDHFRGFEAYWEVPAGEKTAVKGHWVEGPGSDFFHALRHAFGLHQLPIIAEDLGVITPEVEALRDQFELPGMKILQFAFSGGVAKMEAPYSYHPHSVVYTGTHDNDTALGWYRNSSLAEERETALSYMGTDGHQFNWDFIRLAFSTVSMAAIIPLQDVLGLDSAARMNYPSRASGNWTWRVLPGAFGTDLRQRLAELTEIYGRASSPSPKP